MNTPTNRRRPRGRLWSLVLLLPLAGLGAAQDEGAAARAQEDRRARIESLQSRARELMGELEDRMFQLSESLRDAQPEDAARLVLALQRAREELILEEMSAIESELADGDLDAAEELQRGVVRRLESLRDLLLSTDLDLLLKLERLRKLNSALAELQALEEEGERLSESLEELAEKAEAGAGKPGEGAGQKPSEADAREMKGDQLAAEEAREQAERLEADVAEVAGSQSEAAEGLREAADKMEETEQALERSDPSDAQAAQKAANQSLSKAKNDLRRQREELLWDLQPHLRRQVIDALVRMRDELERVRDGLGEVVGASATRVALEGEAARRMSERLRIVEDIGRETGALIRETDFSVHLAAVLEWLDLRLEVPERGFEAARAGTEEVAAAARTHAALDEVLKALLEEDQRWRGARGDEPKRKLIKLVSELKGCRTLQRVLREDTETLDGLRPPDGLGPALEQEVDAIVDLEAQMPEMMLLLEERYWAEVAGKSED